MHLGELRSTRKGEKKPYTYANAYITDVYLDQLSDESGKYELCHPAYHVDATLEVVEEHVPPL